MDATDELAPAPMYKLVSGYAGSNHFRWDGAPKLSPLGVAVADLLGHLYQGIYHLEESRRSKVDWSDPYCITVNVHASHYATWDFGYLTRLVVLCHDLCLRCEIGASGPGLIKLRFHARTRDGGTGKRHPGLTEHATLIRDGYSVEANP